MPKIYDNRERKNPQDFKEPTERESAGVKPPVSGGGDGSIFVSLVAYRDGERCGSTLKSIFENAKHPEKVIVGIVEQNDYSDAHCIDEYCKSYGASVIRKEQSGDGEGVSKIIRDNEEGEKCPFFSQIRLLSTIYYSAKGPMYARSLMRKLLGNEEFCLQLDAHSTLIQDWDVGLQQEWQATQNEYGVISTIPLDTRISNEPFVPRQCLITFQENGVPNYEQSPDAFVEGYSRPLLSHAWSAAFSFAKCHLEETVPYDPFSYYAMPVEQFVRYARMWTRGYDTYTPTRNYVFHDYSEQANGHGGREWFKKFVNNRFRETSIDRAKTILELPDLSDESDGMDANNRANLGLYGLGQRRTLEQMKSFTRFALDKDRGNNEDKGPICVEGHTIVRYDDTISPLANLHNDEGATKLEPYPIFPLRTSPTFSVYFSLSAEEAKHLPDRLDTDHLEIAIDANDTAKVVDPNDQSQQLLSSSRLKAIAAGLRHDPVSAVGPELLEESSRPPSSVLLVLWIFGLFIWYFVFAVKQNAITKNDDKTWLSKQAAGASSKSGTSTSGGTRKTKLVKDV